VVYPYVFTYHKYRETAKIVHDNGAKNALVFTYQDSEAMVTPTLKFYLDRPVTNLKSIGEVDALESAWLLISEPNYLGLSEQGIKLDAKQMFEINSFRSKNTIPMQLFSVKERSLQVKKYLLVEL